MIVLWLLVAHLAGDYLVQTRWQAVNKFGWRKRSVGYRTRHVAGYTACFVPVAFAYQHGWRAFAFLVALFCVHHLTDAQRFVRTPGEWLWWYGGGLNRTRKEAVIRQWLQSNVPIQAPIGDGGGFVLPPNPWPSMGLAIDQTLHVVQIAALATWVLT